MPDLHAPWHRNNLLGGRALAFMLGTLLFDSHFQFIHVNLTVNLFKIELNGFAIQPKRLANLRIIQ